MEIAAAGSLDPVSDAAIKLDLTVVLFATTAMAAVGLLIGFIELVYLDKLFRNRSFLTKILYKLLFYTLLLLIVIGVLYPIAASLELKVPIWDQQVWQKFFYFLGSLPFFSTLLQIGCSLLLCLIYAAISEHIGHAVISNFFTGKYHQPRDELRIFMFLDMKSSTRIAEQLGHHRYFLLLRSFYEDLADDIINHEGEVYQYIGDEVVISWKFNTGKQDNNCLKCFFAMKRALQSRAAYYQQAFSLVPTFKAGLHYGRVTTGEIGALKKEISFSGDVLNATARIQSMCNQFNAELLVSKALIDQLTPGDEFQFKNLGEMKLKGREEAMDLCEVRSSKLEPEVTHAL
ncbi:MAG: hypothetical protein DHS20C17_04590 [Cyclobacteriaceae bacterium]|nr:MAG: hypothetical protein DHS20C17_04590 [Cyclobacteriaceae bacterium]